MAPASPKSQGQGKGQHDAPALPEAVDLPKGARTGDDLLDPKPVARPFEEARAEGEAGPAELPDEDPAG